MASIADRNALRHAHAGKAADQNAAADYLSNTRFSSSLATATNRLEATRGLERGPIEPPQVMRIKREPAPSFSSSIAPGLSSADIQTSLYLNANRTRSGWNTLELRSEGPGGGDKAGGAMVADPSELPPDNAAFISAQSDDAAPVSGLPEAVSLFGAMPESGQFSSNRPEKRDLPSAPPTSHRALRPSRYELASTVSIPREVLLQMQSSAELEAYAQPRRVAPVSAGPRPSAVMATDYDIQSLRSDWRDRLETMAGLSLIMAGLITLGLITAHSWPTDITPAVKAFTSSHVRH